MSMVDLTKLDRTELAEKLRELPVADWNAAVIEARMKASRWRADLWGANLRADLRGKEERLELNGKHIAVGPIGGYTALVFGANNSEGHVIRAGCWTGTVDGLLDRARGESFIRDVLAQWEAGE